ncbi:MAG: hypothetical protein R2747_20345 [Pyrinomonadaceae bacterium]
MNYFSYFSEIEETFIRRRGRNLLLSPLDWALIETWQERKIPLHIVLRGIEKIFDQYDQNPKNRRTIKSLMYCREEIEAQYAEWLESQIGRNGGETASVEESKVAEAVEKQPNPLFSEDSIREHLERVSAELSAAVEAADGDLRKVLEKAERRLARLVREEPDAEKFEEILEKLDGWIDGVLLGSFVTEKLKREVKGQIAAFNIQGDEEVYRRTCELMLAKNLRRRHRIPRLSFFSL